MLLVASIETPFVVGLLPLFNLLSGFGGVVNIFIFMQGTGYPKSVWPVESPEPHEHLSENIYIYL
jgi:hypothetical protein